MPPDAGTAIFEAERPRLIRLAYRMLGSLAEAEDVVQNAWLRWRQADRDAVAAPMAYLTRIVTRLCLDVMKSARARRETYVGAWLPEPLIEESPEDPAEDLTLPLMLALERLSPLERAAFLLHDVFGVPLAEVAVTLERDGVAVRQLAARARKHVRAGRPRYALAPEEGERLARAFFAATSSGDVATLRAMLAKDVVLRADGGGKVLAFLNPIVGRERTLRLYAGLHRKLKTPGRFLRPARIDGWPGYISEERDGVLQTTALVVEDGVIRLVLITRNPDKLGHVARLIGPQKTENGLVLG
ncbi:sigma-70 family RNA polymerase sigma factor [Methylobacterium organophilum]|uniref:ECF RNA polymerase sigma factor SigJ n=1 Tax=Methylobacterium organophilum TaxID=410 RepID=A0ABQ4TEU4_METOR|nr:sigma-70 family RNA polymerase sigma factor [Methylobacterium organophilum]UMY16166.1 sigma-70 family RNA polymerase sigma factor [Methylobacterium organophilum]GJE28862.1 ECF RNA polymerase sigma factor SigJ [Methylobacterium organophilum]